MPHPLSLRLRANQCLLPDCRQCQRDTEVAQELDRLHEELAKAKFDLLAAKHWGSQAAMDAVTIEKAAAWDWCTENGFPNRLWSPEKSVWFYSTFPRFDSPLEAVQSAKNPLAPRP